MVRAYSWPASPHENAFIDTVCDMLARAGVSVKPGRPTQWGTPFQTAELYILHWPDAVFWNRKSLPRLWFRVCLVLANLMVLKARGTKLVWFVHNLQPHELTPARLRAWNFYAASLARLTDGWVTLSPSTFKPVTQRYASLLRKSHTFIWHPPYRNSYCGDRMSARSELGLPPDRLVYGHAGQIRAYKGLLPFADRFESLAPKGARLLIAGNPYDDIGTAMSRLAAVSDCLDWRAGTLSQVAFDRILLALDVFVAPYSRFLHSGALVHALSRGCVVVAPRVPFTEDLADALGDDWVVLYDKALTAETLERARQAVCRLAGAFPDLSTFQPESNLPRLRELLQRIGASPRLAHTDGHV